MAVDTDEWPVTGVRATAMLALLAIHANQRVSVDALMDAAWGKQALYRGGRVEQALRSYQNARRTLREEIGVEPGAELRDLHLVATVHRHLLDVAARTGDRELDLLTDAVGCLAAVADGRPDDGVREGDVGEGVVWVNRLMRGHLRFGSGGGGLFIENRANFTAMAGQHRQAARLYAAARKETRRAAMVWRRRPLTSEPHPRPSGPRPVRGGLAGG